MPRIDLITATPLASAIKRKSWIAIVFLVIEYLIKVAAIGIVPENRKTGSSFAWLMLILFVPVIGLPLFLLLGSPYVRGRRHKLQGEMNDLITSQAKTHPLSEQYTRDIPGVDSIVAANRRLASLPLVTGRNEGLHGTYDDAIREMARAVDEARSTVHVEFYIMAWDDTTDVFFTALADAVKRGVTVRLLFDHIGTRGYPGYGEFKRRLTAAGIQWHPMMPIDLLHGRWRRPDLRNHRKLLVIDGRRGFMGSQNMIDSGYLKPKHARVGRHWKDLNIEVTGPIVDSLSAVFAIDWYTETNEAVPFEAYDPDDDVASSDRHDGAFQLVPSGPGFPTEPNLRMFVSLMHRAQHKLIITSPYFIPEDSLLTAITTAAYRGVEVELFVSEQADQFMVQHAQRSYYATLLDAGVKIYLYPKPTVLHAKHFTVDDEISVIGSSNMDMRSFALDYEIMLLGFGASLASELRTIQDGYRSASRLLTREAWSKEPWYRRYVDNVMRLTSDLQ
ncbi:Cardiolipin synthase A [Frondihabitans sp. 762G35]|uniref:cardiolipin synthase n=1 Tax=Frondihabitans sp. 762G35 TaxID=1446794 RepID=UPI000D1FF0A9|nr:cardiolipin synthase [Frondihabitans sp. 762G35]ARC58533.1 Cardiolipin synthase A [Frondihabitans sp. 762G35]